MRLPLDQAGAFERVHQVSDVTRRAAQDLAELSLRPLWLTLQLPEKLGAGSGEAALRQTRVHSRGQHHSELEQLREYGRLLAPNSGVAGIV